MSDHAVQHRLGGRCGGHRGRLRPEALHRLPARRAGPHRGGADGGCRRSGGAAGCSGCGRPRRRPDPGRPGQRPTTCRSRSRRTTGSSCACRAPRCGQGITTAVAHAGRRGARRPARRRRRACSRTPSRALLNQLTGGSNSVRSLYDPMRTVAAAARARLVTAAAPRWSVPVGQLTTRTRRSSGSRRAARHLRRADRRSGVAGGAAVAGGASRAEEGSVAVPASSASRPAASTPATSSPAGPSTRSTSTSPAPTDGGRPAADHRRHGAHRSTTSAARRCRACVAVARDPDRRRRRGRHLRPGAAGQGRAAGSLERRAARPGCPMPSIRSRLAARDRTVRAPAAARAVRRRHVRLRLRQPRPDGGAHRRRRRAARPGRDLVRRAVADRRRSRPIAQRLGLPAGDASCTSCAAAARSGAGCSSSRGGGRPDLEGDRPAGQADVDPQRRHAPRPLAPGHPPSHPGDLGARPGAVVRAPDGRGADRLRARPRRGAQRVRGRDPARRPQPVGVPPDREDPLQLRRSSRSCSREVPLAVPTGSWRSVYSGTFAAANEIMVDELAKALGSDPVAFRRATLSSPRRGRCSTRSRRPGRGAAPCRPATPRASPSTRSIKSAVACLVEIDASDPASRGSTQGGDRRRRRAVHQPTRPRGPAAGRRDRRPCR